MPKSNSKFFGRVSLQRIKKKKKRKETEIQGNFGRAGACLLAVERNMYYLISGNVPHDPC